MPEMVTEVAAEVARKKNICIQTQWDSIFQEFERTVDLYFRAMGN